MSERVDHAFCVHKNTQTHTDQSYIYFVRHSQFRGVSSYIVKTARENPMMKSRLRLTQCYWLHYGWIPGVYNECTHNIHVILGTYNHLLLVIFPPQFLLQCCVLCISNIDHHHFGILQMSITLAYVRNKNHIEIGWSWGVTHCQKNGSECKSARRSGGGQTGQSRIQIDFYQRTTTAGGYIRQIQLWSAHRWRCGSVSFGQ